VKRILPVEELARDERFVRRNIEEAIFDPRNLSLADEKRPNGFSPAHADAPDNARALMHGIFVGEIQALEGAGRTCWDFETGDSSGDAPFALKLDMARQCWDEARHCEISVKLSDHMGSDIGEYGESTFLFAAACNPDPVMRLCGVNRALEGLAIDVFSSMKAFGEDSGDPILTFCEDWMLADEVTHVKMGSDWLRRLTADDPDRLQRALEFQRLVDKVFSAAGGASNADSEGARAYRKMAGFTDEDIDAAHVPLDPQAEKEARRRLVAGSLPTPTAKA